MCTRRNVFCNEGVHMLPQVDAIYLIRVITNLCVLVTLCRLITLFNALLHVLVTNRVTFFVLNSLFFLSGQSGQFEDLLTGWFRQGIPDLDQCCQFWRNFGKVSQIVSLCGFAIFAKCIIWLAL